MSNRLTVKHAVVGSAIAVYGVPDQLSTLVVFPGGIARMRYPGLDCEGAESLILRIMGIRPRVIAVETHGGYARKTGAPMPVQNRSNIPNPAAKPMTLPPVQVGSKAVIGPGPPSRINSELGGYRPTGTLKPRG